MNLGAHISLGEGTPIKTTIALPDALFERARHFAKARQLTMKALIEQSLRKALAEESDRKPFKLRDGSVKGNGLTPEFQNAGWDRILETIHDPLEGRS